MKKGLAKSSSKRDSKWVMFRYRIAHHPVCDNFDEHFYHLFGIKWCRGCVMMYLGYTTGVVFVIWTFFTNPFGIGFHHFLVWILFIPTVLSAYFEPIRPIRDVTRFLLGISLIQAVVVIIKGIIIGTWWISLILIVSVYLFRKALTEKRTQTNNEVCLQCPELNNPRCSGLKDFHDRQKIQEGGLMRLDVYSE